MLLDHWGHSHQNRATVSSKELPLELGEADDKVPDSAVGLGRSRTANRVF